MKELLKSTLKPLYFSMLENITTEKDVCTFCLQWGANFPQESNTGILFVGKATNGWVTTSRDVDELFEHKDKKVFGKWDQMKWVHNLEGDKKYNTKKSAFWRLIKLTTQSIYGREEWYSNIAWSNVYKISYESGNPDASLKRQQLQVARQILSEEIRILSPRFVVFLTSGWENGFVNHLLNDQDHEWQPIQKWGSKYEVKICLKKDLVIICAQHPQGKSSASFAAMLTSIVNKYSEPQLCEKPVPLENIDYNQH